MNNYNILSFDGGGIRGVLTLSILKKLKLAIYNILDETDFYSGTSTGGIIALALAKGLSVEDILDLYVIHREEIFTKSTIRKLVGFGNLYIPKYDNDDLQRLINEIFENTTLGDLKSKVLIPTFDLDNEDQNDRRWKPKFFHNFNSNKDLDTKIADIALWTSSAPTYFKVESGYIDGGVVANNPSMCALAQVQEGCEIYEPKLDDIRLLSLGTGRFNQYIEGNDHKWGTYQWLSKIISIVYEGIEGVPDYQCRQILGDNYFRINPTLPNGEWQMDNTDAVYDLMEFAESIDIDNCILWVKNKW